MTQHIDQILQDLIDYSQNTNEFNLIFEDNIIKIIKRKESLFQMLFIVLVIFSIPLVMIFTNTDFGVKIFISIIWAIALSIRFFRIFKKNKDLYIDLRNKEIKTENYISAIRLSTHKYQQKDIKKIFINDFITSSTKYGNQLKYYDLTIDLKTEKATICLMENKKIADKLKNLIILYFNLK